MEAREFVVDRAAIMNRYGPMRLIIAGVSCPLFVVGGIWIYETSSDLLSKMVGVGSVAFFGGLPLLTLIIFLITRALGIFNVLRVDTAGVSAVGGFRRLVRFGYAPKTIAVPWSKVDDVRIMDADELPVVRRFRTSMKSAVPFFERLPKPPDVKFVGVTYDQSKILQAGPVVGLTLEQLLETLQNFRKAGAPENP